MAGQNRAETLQVASGLEQSVPPYFTPGHPFSSKSWECPYPLQDGAGSSRTQFVGGKQSACAPSLPGTSGHLPPNPDTSAPAQPASSPQDGSDGAADATELPCLQGTPRHLFPPPHTHPSTSAQQCRCTLLPVARGPSLPSQEARPSPHLPRSAVAEPHSWWDHMTGRPSSGSEYPSACPGIVARL